jgi:dihydroxyacid dehydratase/phosphogluconate dehydratase
VRDCDQIFGNRALVADSVVDVSEVESVDLGDIKFVFEVLEATIEGRDVHGVALGDEVSKDFLSASGVSGAFAVDTVEDVGHETREYSLPARRSIKKFGRYP